MNKKEEYIQALTLSLQEAGKGNAYIHICINYADRLLDNHMPVIFDVTHLSLLLGVEKNYLTFMLFSLEHHYREHLIPKKSGGFRQLYMPSVTLKYIQRWILDNILCHMHLSNYATGFRSKTSIVDNAKLHLNQDCIVNLDISDFFPSIDFETVFRIFNYYGYTKELSYVFAALCVYENMLPQGSPASPYISNVVSLRLDKRLNGLANSYEAVYSRYADDITISGNSGVVKCVPIAKRIIEEEGFCVNEKKTRIAYSYQRQEVTGLTINGGQVRVKKSYKRALMQEIYYCQRFGVDNHLRHIQSDKNFYKEHLYGKAYFLYMVEPDEGKKAIENLNIIKWDY